MQRVYLKLGDSKVSLARDEISSSLKWFNFYTDVNHLSSKLPNFFHEAVAIEVTALMNGHGFL